MFIKICCYTIRNDCSNWNLKSVVDKLIYNNKWNRGWNREICFMYLYVLSLRCVGERKSRGVPSDIRGPRVIAPILHWRSGCCGKNDMSAFPLKALSNISALMVKMLPLSWKKTMYLNIYFLSCVSCTPWNYRATTR